jgi:hypothetical protein
MPAVNDGDGRSCRTCRDGGWIQAPISPLAGATARRHCPACAGQGGRLSGISSSAREGVTEAMESPWLIHMLVRLIVALFGG